MTQDMLNLSDPRASIQLTGPDSRKFLQGQVTCDITLLNSNQPILGAHCNAKGRVIFLFTARCNEQDTIVLETHASIADIAISSLKKYAVFLRPRSQILVKSAAQTAASLIYSGYEQAAQM